MPFLQRKNWYGDTDIYIVSKGPNSLMFILTCIGKKSEKKNIKKNTKMYMYGIHTQNSAFYWRKKWKFAYDDKMSYCSHKTACS